MAHPEVVPLRRLERSLFRAWCGWLCYPSRSAAEERAGREEFLRAVEAVEGALAATPGPYFLPEFGTADVVFTPYIERMSASLYYYKGYTLRDPGANPRISAWFDAMEQRECYRGTQSDFHTHCHDLPPQMGGCYESGDPEQQRCKARVLEGPWEGLPDWGGGGGELPGEPGGGGGGGGGGE
jgi:glutathione S-transferase